MSGLMLSRFADALAAVPQVREALGSNDPARIKALLDDDPAVHGLAEHLDGARNLREMLRGYLDRFEQPALDDARFDSAIAVAVRAMLGTPAQVEAKHLVRGFVAALSAAAIDAGWSETAPPRDQRFEWLTKKTEQPVAGASWTQRMRGTYDISHTAISAHLRAVAPGTELLDTSKLSAAQSAALAQRRKDAISAIFTGLTLDFAGVVEKAATEPGLEALPRVGGPVTQAKPLPWYWKELSESTLRFAGPEALAKLERVETFVGVAGEVRDGSFGSNHFIRVPVGAYGEPLARAMAEAARVAMALARRTDEGEQTHHGKGIYMAGSSRVVLEESVPSIVAALSLLCAHVAHDPSGRALSPSELLDRIAKDGLVTKMSAAAPLGVIVPMSLNGYLPHDAVHVRNNGSQLPLGLVHFFNASRDARVLESAETRAHPYHVGRSKTHPSVESALRQTLAYETLRGCPVSARGPVVDRDGTFRLTDHPPLDDLVTAFVALTKRFLA